LSYANVVATLALFVALGGASYAAITLPANSVRQRQLAFPLGVASQTFNATRRVPISICPPGVPCPAPIGKPLASVVVSLKRAAKLLVLGSTKLLRPPEVPPSDAIQVSIEADLQRAGSGQDAGGVNQSPLDDANPTLQFWQVVSAPAGRQVINLRAGAQATTGPAGDLDADATSITVVVLPPAE
jgi:hypothetical protein